MLGLVIAVGVPVLVVTVLLGFVVGWITEEWFAAAVIAGASAIATIALVALVMVWSYAVGQWGLV